LKKDSHNVPYKMMTTATLYVIFSFFTMSVVIFAWFTIRNDNDAALVASITELDANYELYVYKEPYYLGDSVQLFTENLCADDQMNCYKLLENTQSFFSMAESIAPSMKFSFVLKVSPVSLDQGYIKLGLSGITSTGYVDQINKIQTAFYYEVTKISYVYEDVETDDVKENYPIQYHKAHFLYNQSHHYELVKNVGLHHMYLPSAYVLIYFSFYFDPLVTGYDEMLNPYPNSNIFMNQMFEIKQLVMTLTK